MICPNPKCKTELIKSITFRKKVFSYLKVYNIFCCSCDYSKVKEIKISLLDYKNCLEINKLKATNTKILNTDRKYNQTYKNVNEVLK